MWHMAQAVFKSPSPTARRTPSSARILPRKSVTVSTPACARRRSRSRDPRHPRVHANRRHVSESKRLLETNAVQTLPVPCKWMLPHVKYAETRSVASREARPTIHARQTAPTRTGTGVMIARICITQAALAPPSSRVTSYQADAKTMHAEKKNKGGDEELELIVRRLAFP